MGRSIFGSVPLYTRLSVLSRESNCCEVADQGGDLQCKSLGLDLTSTLALRPEPDLLHTVLNAMLLLSGNIHDIEGQELARNSRERDIKMDLHSLACRIPPSASVIGWSLDGIEKRTSALVDNQLGMYLYPPVVVPFSPCKEEDDD